MHFIPFLIAHPRSDSSILHEFLCFPVDEYERTWEQDEELGLNDMDTSSADMAYNKSDV